MRISIVRGAVYAQHIPHGLEPNGVYIWQDQGLQTFRMLLVPHAGGWQDAGIARLTEEFTTPVPIIYQAIHKGERPQSASFLSVDVPNVVVSALKRAEAGEDLILRCYETAGRGGRATLDLGFVQRRWTGDFRPSEIKTLRVPAAGGEIPRGERSGRMRRETLQDAESGSAGLTPTEVAAAPANPTFTA